MIKQNAICGECGHKYSDHHEYRDVKFCQDLDNCTFSSEPKRADVGWLLFKNHRDIYDRIVGEWKRQYGHTGQEDK